MIVSLTRDIFSLSEKRKRKALGQSIILSLLWMGSIPAIAAPACTPEQEAQILSAPTATDYTAKFTCQPNFASAVTITRQVLFEGEEASDILFDCKGGTIESSKLGPASDPDKNHSVVIRSISPTSSLDTFETWPRPSNITVQHCTIKGDVRIYGLGKNGQSDRVKASSLKVNHTANAQAKAPKNILFSHVTIIANGPNPFYVGPGGTGIGLLHSKIEGHSNGVGVYLDAESIDNNISFNRLDVTTKNREVIALDGSARNFILFNEIKQPETGGIFIYRNCGEGGAVRHQQPTYNFISGNRFYYTKNPTKHGIWLGARGGKQNYCEADAGYPFGSSINNGDFANDNTVRDTSFIGPGSVYFLNHPKKTPYPIQNSGLNNSVSDTKILPQNRLGW